MWFQQNWWFTLLNQFDLNYDDPDPSLKQMQRNANSNWRKQMQKSHQLNEHANTNSMNMLWITETTYNQASNFMHLHVAVLWAAWAMGRPETQQKQAGAGHATGPCCGSCSKLIHSQGVHRHLHPFWCMLRNCGRTGGKVLQASRSWPIPLQSPFTFFWCKPLEVPENMLVIVMRNSMDAASNLCHCLNESSCWLVANLWVLFQDGPNHDETWHIWTCDWRDDKCQCV